MNKNIFVLYHKHCFDGFGGAWAAWRKFKDNAIYIAVSDRSNLPPELNDIEDKSNLEVYVIDFCYPKEVMLDLESKVKLLMVLDHHKSVKEAVTSVKHHVYEEVNSGAYIAWEYFEGKEVPLFLEYLSDADTLQKKMPHWEEVTSYIYTHDFTFENYEKLMNEFKTDQNDLKYIIEKGNMIKNYLNLLYRPALDGKELVMFEGYEVYATNAAFPIDEKSRLGMLLYEEHPPFSIVYRYDNGMYKVSLRSNGEVDVSVIASKYGGGGHRGAAGFAWPANHPLPFVKSLNNEDNK